MPVKIVLNPGRHDRLDVPMMIPTPAGLADGGVTLNPGGIPGQAFAGKLGFIVPRMEAGKPVTLTVEPGTAPAAVTMEEKQDALTFSQGSELVTRYHFGERSELPLPARPYFYPVNQGGICLTREITPKGKPQPKIDHGHHRSLWVAHGDVNGSDSWSEEPGHGFQRHQSFTWQVTTGPVFCGFEEKLTWEDKDGKRLMAETRTFRMWRGVSGGRCLDLDVDFHAAFGDVKLGDTKEGGICAVRVKEPLQGDRTGLMTTAWGGRGEADIWGHRSPWIDYSGTLEDKKVGIAIFDHPTGFRFPTHWHARDYGLVTANPFAWHDYQSGWSTDGSHMIRAGESIPFRYRIFLHTGDCAEARVAERWLDFGRPPAIETRKG